MKKETLLAEYEKLQSDALRLGLEVSVERTRQGQFNSCTLAFPGGQRVKTQCFWTARRWVTNYELLKTLPMSEP